MRAFQIIEFFAFCVSLGNLFAARRGQIIEYETVFEIFCHFEEIS